MTPLAFLVVFAAAAEHPGKAVFESAGCLACHRVGTRGDASGPDLTLVGVRRGREWLDLWLKDPTAWKKDTLMPRPNLRPRDRAVLVEYLAGLKGQAFAARPWDLPAFQKDPVARGRELYNKAGCVACHGTKGRGGHPNNNVPGGEIQALSKSVGTFTREELRARIKIGSVPAPADPKGPAPLARMPAWGEVLSDDEIDAVAAYLETLAEKTADW